MAESEDRPRDGHLSEWRLKNLEDDVKGLAGVIQQATTALGAQITALSNQIGTGLASLPEFYAPRREAEERHRGINERLDAIDRRQVDTKANVDQRMIFEVDSLEKRIADNARQINQLRQGLIATLLAALGALATAVIDLLKPR